MYALSVTVRVKAEAVAAFIAATIPQASHSRREAGTIYYEVVQSEDDPTVFVIFEAYTSPEAFAFHRTAPHCLEWKAAIEPLLKQPRVAVRGNLLEI
jgi:autoinducer 2-degrading protein